MYQVDAFASQPFEGNPAAVCPLSEWLPDDLMQAIALENNLSETAFFVREPEGYRIRWFTPVAEVDLCGHATMAAAHVLFNHMKYPEDRLYFESRSGPLVIARQEGRLVMDFPAQRPLSCKTPPEIVEAFGKTPVECLKAIDYIAVFETEADVSSAAPEGLRLAELDLRTVAITSPGRKHDFVCRVFAPKLGIYEDPVTGSAYTQLAPYWAQRLGRRRLHARQISARGGEVACEVADERVMISGKAVTYLEGRIDIRI